MAVDLLNIKPSVVSRDLRGRYVLLYGKEKSGKTTAATSFPNSLLLAFEKGYNALGNIYAQDIDKWSTFKLVLRQLENPEVQKKFSTIIIDTVSIAYDMVETYICQQNGVQRISEVPWGQGFTAAKKEFENALRRITFLNYGLVLIAHNSTRTEKGADGSDIEIIYPDLPKRAAEICNGLVDIIGYIGTEFHDGKAERYLYTRETPTLFAGSRYKYLRDKIPFSYENLVNAISDAVDEAEQRDGITVVDKEEKVVEEKLDYNKIREEASNIWKELVAINPENAKIILKKVEMIFGRQMKLSEITEDQVDLFNLVLLDMRDLKNSIFNEEKDQ